MILDPQRYYPIICRRDARHDGRVFTCVRSTGIFCRPICPARTPRIENCLFVPSAAAAQAAGFRPCRRCHPERAPDQARHEHAPLLRRALAMIDAGALDQHRAGELSRRLGLSERQLRRLFSQQLGATPQQMAQTRRLQLARQLLDNNHLPITEVALASGFSSLRRFNECFLQHFGQSPSAVRRSAPDAEPAQTLKLRLAYRPPLHWPALLGFLAARALPGVEQIDNGVYQRHFPTADGPGWVRVGCDAQAHQLSVEVSLPRLADLGPLLARLRRVFDLDADPQAIDQQLRQDQGLAQLLEVYPGLRVPGAWDGLETALRAVLGQQISVAAARSLAVQLFANGAADAASVDALNIPQRRKQSLKALIALAADTPQCFEPGADPVLTRERLLALPGIGEWTASYIALRVHRDADAFLPSDLALQRALAVNGERPSTAEVRARAERWAPWRGYALMLLWQADADRAAASRTPPRC